MEGKLYEVKLEYTVFVVADCEDEAIHEARCNVDREEYDLADAHEMKKGDAIPASWVNSLPYGSTDDDETVGKIMEGI